MISTSSNCNLEPLNQNEGKALNHNVALQDNVVYESSGGTIKVNSQIHVDMHVRCMLACKCTHMHIYTQPHMHARTHTHTHTYTCARTHARTHTHIHTQIIHMAKYVHTYTQTYVQICNICTKPTTFLPVVN